MDKEYTITSVDRRDEWRSSYATNPGNDMVDYAVALEGEQGWIKLSQKITTAPPQVGAPIFGHIENKPDRNGNENRKFKKVNPNYSGNRSGGQAAPSVDLTEIRQMLGYAVQMLEEMSGRRDVVQDTQPEPSAPPKDGGYDPDDPFAGLV